MVHINFFHANFPWISNIERKLLSRSWQPKPLRNDIFNNTIVKPLFNSRNKWELHSVKVFSKIKPFKPSREKINVIISNLLITSNTILLAYHLYLNKKKIVTWTKLIIKLTLSYLKKVRGITKSSLPLSTISNTVPILSSQRLISHPVTVLLKHSTGWLFLRGIKLNFHEALDYLTFINI